MRARDWILGATGAALLAAVALSTPHSPVTQAVFAPYVEATPWRTLARFWIACEGQGNTWNQGNPIANTRGVGPVGVMWADSTWLVREDVCVYLSHLDRPGTRATLMRDGRIWRVVYLAVYDGIETPFMRHEFHRFPLWGPDPAAHVLRGAAWMSYAIAEPYVVTDLRAGGFDEITRKQFEITQVGESVYEGPNSDYTFVLVELRVEA